MPLSPVCGVLCVPCCCRFFFLFPCAVLFFALSASFAVRAVLYLRTDYLLDTIPCLPHLESHLKPTIPLRRPAPRKARKDPIMALLNVDFWGESLQKMCCMTVILPDRIPTSAKLPVLYQLHGLSDDHSAWARRSRIEMHVAKYPLVVIMPDGGRGFYCDAHQGYAYESHIIKDVISFAERFFPVGRSRPWRAIGGLSMGGYGSLKLALKYPNKFVSVAAHSSATQFAHKPLNFGPNPEFERIMGPDAPGGPNDLYALADKLDPQRAPAIRFDCGTDDSLYHGNREFHRHLRKLGIKHHYSEHPGGHTWDYWDTHVQSALRFHWRYLKHPGRK